MEEALRDAVDSVWSSKDVQQIRPPCLSSAHLPLGPLASGFPLCLEWASAVHRVIPTCMQGPACFSALGQSVYLPGFPAIAGQRAVAAVVMEAVMEAEDQYGWR